MKKFFVLLPSILLIISCANSGKLGSGSVNHEIADDYESPCEIFSQAKIKEVLSIPASAKTEIYEKQDEFPICFYTWESVTFPGEIGREDRKVIDMPAEASIALIKDVTTKGYENSVRVYDDGENIDGIGEMAKYSPKKRQLTFLSQGNLVHIRVRTSGDEASNKEKAIHLAKLVDARF